MAEPRVNVVASWPLYVGWTGENLLEADPEEVAKQVAAPLRQAVIEAVGAIRERMGDEYAPGTTPEHLEATNEGLERSQSGDPMTAPAEVRVAIEVRQICIKTQEESP